jgi:2-keto-3-deoxy-L-fuconate dehydrogenase
MTLADKVAVVTGAASGVGRAVAELFARHGARVVPVDRDGAVSARPPAGAALPIVCDIADPSAVDALARRVVQEFGRYEVLVNAAGVVVAGPAGETAEADWDRVFAVNAKGTWLMCRAALRPMVAQRAGVIINTASGAALRPLPRLAAYAASKAAIVSLTRSIALEYGEHGVRASCICPGMIDTPMRWAALDARAAAGDDPSAALAPYAIRRLGRAEEVAEAALFLACAEYITGATLAVDAGRTLH